MIVSIYQIDFIGDAATATRLLDIGDLMSAMLSFSAVQQASSYISLGLPWGGTTAAGGARRPLTWTRGTEHGSHAAAAGYCISHPATMPFASAGKLRVTISGGEVWDLYDAVILNAGCVCDADGTFGTLATYQADAGISLPVSGLAHFAGMPTAWILSTHAAQTLTTSAV